MVIVIQSYGDIDITKLSRGPRRFVHSASAQSSIKHGQASEPESKTSLTEQRSPSKIPSESEKLERISSKKLQEQWDKEIPVVSLRQILKKNAPEWWMIALGLIGSMVAGAVSPLFSIFFGKILGVFANPPDKIFPLVHPWAGLFLALACVTGIANLSKVCMCLCV